jgi:hypothetical protein
MAWGIIMTVLTMVGMLALVMYEVAAPEPQTEKAPDSGNDAVVTAASALPLAA